VSFSDGGDDADDYDDDTGEYRNCVCLKPSAHGVKNNNIMITNLIMVKVDLLSYHFVLIKRVICDDLVETRWRLN
jgi:hypothetical protein